MQKKNEEYLTIKEIAEKTNLNPGKLYALTHYDRLECETFGSRILVRKNVFEEWQKANITPQEKEEDKKKEKK